MHNYLSFHNVSATNMNIFNHHTWWFTNQIHNKLNDKVKQCVAENTKFKT